MVGCMTSGSTRIERYKRDNFTFDVLDSGPLAGEPVILLHGWPQRATMYDQVTPVLNEAGYRTFCPDQRGYSPGARPRSRFAYRVRSLVEDVVALIDEIGQPVHLVAHDWGAVVAWSLAGRHPGRIRSLTVASVGHPAAYMRSWLGTEQARKSWYMAVFQLPILPERALTKTGGRAEDLLEMPPGALERFRREYVGDGAVRGGVNWYRSLPLATPSDMRKVSVPTTLIWSDGDTACGETQARRTANWVTGPYELVVLRGVSHWIPEEAPAEFAAAILQRINSVATSS
jgi:pimeloyl-ACP methyl ester carboxylesterase